MPVFFLAFAVNSDLESIAPFFEQHTALNHQNDEGLCLAEGCRAGGRVL